MLIADSDSYSSFLSRSPIKANSVETLDESSSSPIASIVQSLALSSPDRDLRRDYDQGPVSTVASISPRISDGSSSFLSPSSMKPKSVGTLDESSSPILQSLALSSPNRRDDHDSLSTEASISTRNPDGFSFSSITETLAPVSLEPEPQILLLDQPRSFKAQDDIDDEFWGSCSSNRQDFSFDSEMECVQPLLRLKQEPLIRIKEPTGVGAGLWNLGNTCFINSVLQCITHTVPLIESLRSYKYQEPCYCNQEFCVLKTLRDHIDAALRPSSYPLSPYYFLNNLNYFSPDFQRYQQEDAHEFLQAFLNKLEGCCLDRSSDRGSTSSQDVNIVDRVFGGRLVSRLQCCNCNSVSETFESSLGLSLEIEDVDNLGSALESFTRVEKLDDQLTCDDCEEKVSKEKQLLLDKLPLIAMFHLKRFKNNGFFMEKIFKHVKIPLELDLQLYMSGSLENEVPTKYYLYALVNHLGISLAYGHYSSYVRSAPDIWHHFDDVQVSRISEERLLSEDSYILFYAREGTPWFSKAFEEMQPLFEASLLVSSPNSVLQPTSGECLSDISYENVDKSNNPCDSSGVITEENFGFVSDNLNDNMFLSAESSGCKVSPMAEIYDSFENIDFDYPCTAKELDSCIAVERATTDEEFGPRLMFENQDSSPKQQGGTSQIQVEHLETTKRGEEAWQLPSSVSDIADSKETNVMKKCSPRDIELDQAISNAASPPKKLKKDTDDETYCRVS